MNTLLALVRKEARDVRVTAWVSAVALAAMALLLTWFLRARNVQWDAGSARLFTVVGIALGAALGGGAVAADLFAGDTSSKRVRATALLPVGLGRIFAAKAAVVLAVTTLMGAWMMAWCPAAMCAFGAPGPAIAAFEALEGAAPAVALAVAVVSAVMLFGVVLEHGLGSVAVALGLVLGGAVAVTKATPWEDWGLAPGATTATVICAFVSAVFVGTAALAFVSGPIHLDHRFRRAVLGAGTAFAVLGGSGWAAASIGAARADLEPGDEAVRVSSVLASPDGRWALLFVGNARVPANCHAWAVRMEDGTLTPLPGRRRTFEGWTADGRVRLWESKRVGGSDVTVSHTIDLETGAIVATRSADQVESEPWTEGWARFQRTPRGFLVEWPERGLRMRIEEVWRVEAGPTPGRFLAWKYGRETKVVDIATGAERATSVCVPPGAEIWADGGRTLRYRTVGGKVRALDCETGEDREVALPDGEVGRISTGPYAAVRAVRTRSEIRSEIVDLRDCRTVAGPWTNRNIDFVPGTDHVAILYCGSEPATLVDCATGREATIEPSPNSYGHPPNLIHGLPDGTFLLLRPTGGLDVIDADAKVVRTVMPDGAHRVVRRPTPR